MVIDIKGKEMILLFLHCIFNKAFRVLYQRHQITHETYSVLQSPSLNKLSRSHFDPKIWQIRNVFLLYHLLIDHKPLEIS